MVCHESIILFLKMSLILVILLVIIAVAIIYYLTYVNTRWTRLLMSLKPSPVKENYQEIVRAGGRRDRKGVISYSLYGNWYKYLQQLLQNVKEISRQLPSWQARVYLSKEVPREVRNELLYLKAEVIVMPTLPGRGGSMWRFLPGNENLNFVSLDADDTFECAQVIKDWMASRQPFLLLHDGGYIAPVWAGMFGARAGTVSDIKSRMEKYREYWYGHDEEFLKQEIWPTMKDNGYYLKELMLPGVLGYVPILVKLKKDYFPS